MKANRKLRSCLPCKNDGKCTKSIRIATDIALFHQKNADIFLISPLKRMLWYSLEAPLRDASNEYHNICFRREIRKILCGYPLLSVAMYTVPLIHTYGYLREYTEQEGT